MSDDNTGASSKARGTGAGEDSETRLRGKVAEVVSDREVILNRGADHGVQVGMYFAILDPGAVGITDPDTNEPLGDIKVVKIVVRAIEVAPKITLARTFRTRTINVGGTGALGLRGLASAMQEPNFVEKVEKLTLDRNSLAKSTQRTPPWGAEIRLSQLSQKKLKMSDQLRYGRSPRSDQIAFMCHARLLAYID
ncbi:hypothetical protein [Clavibacter zhangzhiyongii]|uniref:hypothetical protein n=1 Tax=Clavibacter zhangzhiyongii TaxID=2768071 RepID=UPI0039DF46CB